MTSGARVEVRGLVSLVRELKGPAFRQVNYALRQYARDIAEEVRPHVALLVAMSPAPQSTAMAQTVRTKPDRVPVIVIGKVNPKFKGSKFSRPGQDSKKRRGSLAHGVVYGPKGGKRSTTADENYYAPQQRDDSGGAIGRSVKSGTVFELAAEAYVAAYLDILTHHGFVKDSHGKVHWGGGR